MTITPERLSWHAKNHYDSSYFSILLLQAVSRSLICLLCLGFFEVFLFITAKRRKRKWTRWQHCRDVRAGKKHRSVLSRWSTLLFTEKINTSEDSFKHWKWAFTVLFSHSHLETGVLLFVGCFESLHTQRLNELAMNEPRNYFPHVLSGHCRETLS